MGWSFTEIKSKKTGLTNYVVHTSFRRENKVTSANCGAIKDIESLRKNFKTEKEFEEYIKAEGAKIYQKRKDDQKINHSLYSMRVMKILTLILLIHLKSILEKSGILLA